MHKLTKGLHRFQASVFGEYQALFERLAQGQSPEVLWITCSDSRVQPSLITQSNPGELFIGRNPGNIVPTYASDPGGGMAATIEYAVTALGVRDIVVCGHSDCGAVKGLFEANLGMPSVTAWLSHAVETLRILQEHYGELEPRARIDAAIEENILVQLEHLRTHPCVASALESGRVRLHGWFYDIESGLVYGYDAAAEQFAKIC